MTVTTVTATLGPGHIELGGYALIVHGGAGDSSGARLDGQVEGCHRAAEAAKKILDAGGAALDAVQAAVEILEDDSRFNAATGGALTAAGTLELDASIMEGVSLRAGAVCGLPPFKHPIAIARAALDDGRHVLYAGEGAAAFARECGFVPADPASMITDEARQHLERVLRGVSSDPPWPAPAGTVGAVARDRLGHVAAATSTGGIVGKRSGRVGDSPLLGAGTYADDALGAASATGQGEGIMRVALTSRIMSALSAAANPGNAAFDALELMKQRTNMRGGVIVIDRDGRIGWARSTGSMAYAASWQNHKITAGG
jgi:beta-aspartyl-peptidase (threonine type)